MNLLSVSGCEFEGLVVQVFEPVGEVEFAAGEVAGGNEAENGVLKLGGKLGEGVVGAGAGDGFDLVETEAIVKGDGWRGGVGWGCGGAGDESCVEARGGVVRAGMGEKQGDRLKGGELGGVEVLGDVEGAAVDEAFQPDGWRRVSCTAQRSYSHLFGIDGHDTSLLVVRALHI
jgi:hypothetical protein